MKRSNLTSFTAPVKKTVSLFFCYVGKLVGTASLSVLRVLGRFTTKTRIEGLLGEASRI